MMRSHLRQIIVAVSVSALLGAIPMLGQAQPQALAPNQRLAYDVYKQLIETNTMDTVGSVTKAVDAMAVRFRAAGFPANDIHILTPLGHPTKANQIVRYRGTGTEKPLLLLAHLDVVAELETAATGAAMRAIVTNSNDSTASANVNCRIVPTQTPNEVRESLARVFSDTGIKLTETVAIHEKSGAAPSALTPELMNPVIEITHSMFGANVPVVPVMSTGAADGRFLRASEILTYGVNGIFGNPADSRAHGRDERLLVKSFYDGQEFLYRLVHRLAGGK